MDKTKKIAVNTIFLCFRMLVLMLISFYSSRVLLKELGVTDFGIYGLVGGVSLKTGRPTAIRIRTIVSI